MQPPARSPLLPPPPAPPHAAAPAPPRRLCLAALPPTAGGSLGSTLTGSSARGPRKQTRKQDLFWYRWAYRALVLIMLAGFYVLIKFVMPFFMATFYVLAAFFALAVFVV